MTSSIFAKLTSPTVTVACGEGASYVTTDACDLVVASRRLLMRHPGADLQLRDGAHASHVSRKRAMRELGNVVPSHGPAHPLVAFVAHTPSPVDAVRGCGLTGPIGAVFEREYLAPLGLAKADVMVTHVTPVVVASERATPATDAAWKGWVHKELDRHNPAVVVALGRQAKAALGARAHLSLPHPGAHVLHKGRESELVRKLRALGPRLDALRTGARTVAIGKAAGDKQIVYGAALDPYQFDSQDDWVPAWEVEQTAHDYLRNSRVVNLQHEAPAKAQVVESWLVHYPSDEDYRAAMSNEPHAVYDMPYGNQEVHSGTWMLGVHVQDPAIWAAVKAGEITAFSIGGTGYRQSVDRATALPQVTHLKP